MKVHFAASEGTHSVIRTYTFPQVFDIKEDIKESFELWGNEGYVHAWVMGPVSKILAELQVSMKKYPNIKSRAGFFRIQMKNSGRFNNRFWLKVRKL